MNESNDTGRGRLKRIVMAVVGIGLSAAGLWYVFKDVNSEDLLASARRVHVLPLIGSLVIYWCGLVTLRSFLVKHLLRSVGALTFFQAYRYISIGFLANNVLPFRAGDLARAAAISRGVRISFPSVVGGLALERMLDLVMVALIGLVAIQLADLRQEIQLTALISAVVLTLALVAFALVARTKWKEKTPDPEHRVRAFIWNLWVRFSAGFGALGTARGILFAALLALGIWFMAVATFMLRLAAFPDLDGDLLVMTLVTLTGLGFGVAVPSAPGFVGVYHFAVTVALVEGCNQDHDAAVAFGLISWMVDIGVGSTIGAISLSIEGLGLRELRKKMNSKE